LTALLLTACRWRSEWNPDGASSVSVRGVTVEHERKTLQSCQNTLKGKQRKESDMRYRYKTVLTSEYIIIHFQTNQKLQAAKIIF